MALERMTDDRRVAAGDVRLGLEVFGEGPPLVYVHGLGGCRHLVSGALAPLGARHRIIVFTQRGHCDSTPVRDPSGFDPHRMAEDLGAVLDHLEIERAAVVGESMGAATSLLFAIRHPARVEQLVQIAPTAVDQPNPSREVVEALADIAVRHGLAGAAAATTLVAMSHGVPRAVAEAVTSHWVEHDLESFVAAHRAVPEWQVLPSLDPVGDLDIPIGVLAWGGDPTRPVAQARRLATAARRGHLETVASITEFVTNPMLFGTLIERLLAA
jgi:pimeloyl-ACP methyl ester carboxylesterase